MGLKSLDLFSSVVYCCCVSSFVHVHVYIFICTLLVNVVLCIHIMITRTVHEKLRFTFIYKML